jgi:hypothetical protein
LAKKSGNFEEAELILRLYELRRETVMRQARSFVGGMQFLPKSAREFLDVMGKGGQESTYVLQVYGYWDMVSGFVKHGTLSEALVYDTCQEMYFQYAKIQPYLNEFRKQLELPEWMENLEGVIEGSAKGRRRIAAMRKSIGKMIEFRDRQASA